MIVREAGALLLTAHAGESTGAAPWLERLARFGMSRGALIAAVAAVVLLGGLLRLWRFDALSLWLDEGFTVRFSRLPWVEVLGLQGQYDPHPPLYYALVKLVAVVVPDVQAGRLLSVLTGTATIAVLYLIVARLMRPAAGLIAALLLALSPLHLWYSQEARQYAPMTLAIALAYLALIKYERERRWRWAGLYGAASLTAVYIDYSAIFALLPTAGVVLWFIYRHRCGALPLVVASALAVLAFLPWLPQALESAEREGADRAWYLGVSVERMQSSLLSVAGLHGRGLYYWGEPAPWERWAGLHLFLAGLLVFVAALGLIALTRKSLLSAGIVAGLAGGTVAIAAALSLLSPAYAERTILPATLGWCALVACAPFVTSNRIARVAVAIAVVAWFGLSLVTLDAVRDGDKQHWNALAEDAGRAADFGWPVVMAPAVTETLVELYAPELEDAEQITMGGYGELPPGAPELIDGAEALWFVHVESPESAFARDQLVVAGFEPVIVSRHRDRLLLELLVRPGSPPGDRKPIGGGFALVGEEVAGWNFDDAGGRFESSGRGAAVIRDQKGESGLWTVVEADEGLGYFELEARSSLSSGALRAFLICQDEAGAWTRVAPDGAGASVENDGEWHTVRIATLCPAGTTSARLDLRNAGVGTVEFRDAQLFWALDPDG